VFSPRLFNRCGFRPGHAAWPAPEGRLKYDRRGNAGIKHLREGNKASPREVSVVATQTMGRAIGGVMGSVSFVSSGSIAPGLSFLPELRPFFAIAPVATNCAELGILSRWRESHRGGELRPKKGDWF
jgi:hypothetical protein